MKDSLGKRALKRLGRIITLAAVLTLAAALYPYAKDLIGGWLPQGRYERASRLISHEMEQAGDLIAVRHRDTGLMEAGMQALLVGEVNHVKAPYAYEIGLGFHLADVTLKTEAESITVTVPPVQMLYDSFQITDSPEISDFWRLMGEADYQRLVDQQAAECRRGYLENEETMDQAWESGCRELEKLFAQWTGEELQFTFRQAGTN